MGSLNVNHVPVIIDTTFYRYNYIEYKMWAQIRNQLDYKDMGDNSMIISAQQLKTFIVTNYSSEINKVGSYGFHVPRKDATAIYFLHRVSSEMINLKYLKITLDSDKSFTRVIEDDVEQTIKYDFAILKAKLDLSDIFVNPELQVLNSVLESIGLLSAGIPYSSHTADLIFTRLSGFLDSSEDELSLESQLASALLDAIDVSLDKENPMILLITDYI
jgi:hypothetical protein|tara:strand:- start:56 stop:706 length:651 start_codon:yes stop_codon:yes gene_type:complete